MTVAGPSQPDPEKRVRAVRAPSAITIDGRLDESAWVAAIPVSGFVQSTGAPGEPASQPTEVRVLYDDRNLYVGMRMFDANPDSILAQIGSRGATDILSDWAHLEIDSYLDRRSAYKFSISPAGVLRDARIYEEIQVSYSWDGVWEGAAQVDSLGWTAEFRIPLSQLRFNNPGGASVLWGINFGRDLARNRERSYWVPIPPDARQHVSLFGELEGLEGIETPRRVEIIPYALARGSTGLSQLGAAELGNADVGLDMRVGIGSNLSFAATVNPDFGQVEADPTVVNLTAFETFFPERRPFFTEGEELFTRSVGAGTGGPENLFYSRRIGRSPQGHLPPGVTDARSPISTRILGAGRLTGRTPSGWSLGVLSALTAREEGSYLNEGAARVNHAVEPMAHYAVARVSRVLPGGRSSFGLIGTSVNRRIEDSHLEFLPDASYSFAVDGQHRFSDGNHELIGWVAGSWIEGSELAIQRVQTAPNRFFHRPDALHLAFDPEATSIGGTAANLIFQRSSGGPWRYGAIIHRRSPGFDVNDVGFIASTDRVVTFNWVGFIQNTPGRLFRRWSVFSSNAFGRTHGGETVLALSDVNGLHTFHNQWDFSWSLQRRHAVRSTDALRGGPALRLDPLESAQVSLTTDPRNALTLSGSVRVAAERGSPTRSTTTSYGVRWRPSPQLEMQVNPTYTAATFDPQFVARATVSSNAESSAGRTDFLIGMAKERTYSIQTRLSLALTPTFTVQFFGQPLVSSVAFSDYRVVRDPHASARSERFARLQPDELRLVETDPRPTYAYFPDGSDEAALTFGDPGFSVKSFRSNLVIRWDYRPGSTLFFVWQQDRRLGGGAGEVRVPRDLRSIFDEAGAHTVQVRVTYWLGR